VTTHDALVVVSTASTSEEAIGLGRRLVEERLAACVNVLSGARSIFFWEGALQEADEAVLLIKTDRARYQQLERRIRELHSYSVPEVLAVSVEMGLPAYVAWLKASVSAAERGDPLT
jgi:periplasmic divalent cation tolerance protein